VVLIKDVDAKPKVVLVIVTNHSVVVTTLVDVAKEVVVVKVKVVGASIVKAIILKNFLNWQIMLGWSY
jgi:hypothetical protein